jgi:hypothetical protein
MKKLNGYKFPRPLKGGLIALMFALLVHVYFTELTTSDGPIFALAYNSKSPFLMIFCFSIIIVCITAMRNDAIEWFTNGKALTPEERVMSGMVLVSGIIFILLVVFQDCREINVEFHTSQASNETVLLPGDIFQARLNSAVSVLAEDQSDTGTPMKCEWQSSIKSGDIKITDPSRCKTLVKSTQPGVMILTLKARPPRCSSQYLVPVTIGWR